MKWIALAILLIIGPYTFLRWHYRKPGPAFEPYHDLKDQANTQRLHSAGFHRITLDAEHPADASRQPAISTTTAAVPSGLPSTLASSLVETPVLPSDILWVNAAPETNTLFTYTIDFTCRTPDNKQQVSAAHLYSLEGEMFVIAQFEPLSGELRSRHRDTPVRLTVPAGRLHPGTYHVTIVGEHSSKAWSLLVK